MKKDEERSEMDGYGVLEDDIVKEIYGSSKEWVSVEVKLSQSLDPSTLFHLTDNEAGDCFYMRLNDNRTSYFGYKAIQLFKIILKINNLFLKTGKN